MTRNMPCISCDYRGRPTYDYPCSRCDMTKGSPFCMYEHEEKPTRADHIRNMNNEELATFLWEFELDEIAREGYYFITKRKLEEWLKQHMED